MDHQSRTLEKYDGEYWLLIDNSGDEAPHGLTLEVGGVRVPFVAGTVDLPYLVIAARSGRAWRTDLRAVYEGRLPYGAPVSWVRAGGIHRRQLEPPR